MNNQTSKCAAGWGGDRSQVDKGEGAPGWSQSKRFPSAAELDNDPYAKHLTEVQNDPHRASTAPR